MKKSTSIILFVIITLANVLAVAAYILTEITDPGGEMFRQLLVVPLMFLAGPNISDIDTGGIASIVRSSYVTVLVTGVLWSLFMAIKTRKKAYKVVLWSIGIIYLLAALLMAFAIVASSGLAD